MLLPDDLADVHAPQQLMDSAVHQLGSLSAVGMSHCESVDSSILSTTVQSWDRHFAVNARATWLPIKALADHLGDETVSAGQVRGHVVALTSDHTSHNTPYGASKGAMDRIVVAAAIELAARGVRPTSSILVRSKPAG